MEMEKLTLVLSTAGTILGLLLMILATTCKWIKNSKAKKIAENIIKIGNFILPYIEEAEKFVAFTGEEKKAYVMTKANQYAIDNKIEFDEAKTSAKIDEIVALCKVVNIKASNSDLQKDKSMVMDDCSNLAEDKLYQKQKNIIK